MNYRLKEKYGKMKLKNLGISTVFLIVNKIQLSVVKAVKGKYKRKLLTGAVL